MDDHSSTRWSGQVRDLAERGVVGVPGRGPPLPPPGEAVLHAPYVLAGTVHIVVKGPSAAAALERDQLAVDVEPLGQSVLEVPQRVQRLVDGRPLSLAVRYGSATPTWVSYCGQRAERSGSCIIATTGAPERSVPPATAQVGSEVGAASSATAAASAAGGWAPATGVVLHFDRTDPDLDRVLTRQPVEREACDLGPHALRYVGEARVVRGHVHPAPVGIHGECEQQVGQFTTCPPDSNRAEKAAGSAWRDRWYSQASSGAGASASHRAAAARTRGFPPGLTTSAIRAPRPLANSHCRSGWMADTRSLSSSASVGDAPVSTVSRIRARFADHQDQNSAIAEVEPIVEARRRKIMDLNSRRPASNRQCDGPPCGPRSVHKGHSGCPSGRFRGARAGCAR